MSPYLIGDLSFKPKGLVQFIAKLDLHREATGPKLFMVDLDSKETFVTYSKVEIGFSTEKAVKEAIIDGNVSERQMMELRTEYKAFVVKLLEKLLEKCQVTFSFVKRRFPYC